MISSIAEGVIVSVEHDGLTRTILNDVVPIAPVALPLTSIVNDYPIRAMLLVSAVIVNVAGSKII